MLNHEGRVAHEGGEEWLGEDTSPCLGVGY